MLRSLTRQEIRNVDKRAIEEFGMSGLQLMENAGRGAAELLVKQQPQGTILIVAGKGNNGGDGFVMARHLENAGCLVDVLLLADAENLTEDAAVNFRIIQKSHVSITHYNAETLQQELNHQLSKANWVVDAMLGTGTTGNIREPYQFAIDQINQSGKNIFSVDLPSGLDCDTGESLGRSIQATVTATFVSSKIGFDVPASQRYLGKVYVIDIGVPKRLLRSL
ncbi:NAD(P)H-hydrate epimerase / ADP-dependent (S)-NAD(P)H-hydrate dehydratase [hydrothermal vent metagenome]|uniref:NAD(P)H-hydrate epimerase / ADP-dependent (S)-NAD(P)H-hydrate dehydratase n=1 Tax=hydrothermal vent metagenome TaxID=652676 RepID=A0A3B1DH53_9ZZZZ